MNLKAMTSVDNTCMSTLITVNKIDTFSNISQKLIAILINDNGIVIGGTAVLIDETGIITNS